MDRHVTTVRVPAPAAGADWSFKPSDIDRVKVLTVTAKLVTSVTVANRHPALTITDRDQNQYLAQDAQFTQAASLSAQYSWAPGLGNPVLTSALGGTRVGFPFPYPWLEPGDTIATATAGLDAADQWSAIVVRFYTADHWKHWEHVERLMALLDG